MPDTTTTIIKSYHLGSRINQWHQWFFFCTRSDHFWTLRCDIWTNCRTTRVLGMDHDSCKMFGKNGDRPHRNLAVFAFFQEYFGIRVIALYCSTFTGTGMVDSFTFSILPLLLLLVQHNKDNSFRYNLDTAWRVDLWVLLAHFLWNTVEGGWKFNSTLVPSLGCERKIHILHRLWLQQLYVLFCIFFHIC